MSLLHVSTDFGCKFIMLNSYLLHFYSQREVSEEQTGENVLGSAYSSGLSPTDFLPLSISISMALPFSIFFQYFSFTSIKFSSNIFSFTYFQVKFSISNLTSILNIEL